MAYMEVIGTVISKRWEDKIVILKEEYQKEFKGEVTTRKRLWTCWFDTPSSLQEGQSVKIGGDLDTRIGKWDKKTDDGRVEERQIVEHHLVNATLTGATIGDYTF